MKKIKETLSIILLLTMVIMLCLSAINIAKQNENDIEMNVDNVELKEKTSPIRTALIEYARQMKNIESIEDKKDWFLSYKYIVDKYDDLILFPKTIYDRYSYEEIYIIQRCVETETYQCSFDAKVNVAKTILNRVVNERFPDSPSGVVKAKNQFVYIRKNISKDTILAVEYAYLFGADINDALFFQSDQLKEHFSGGGYIGTDGYHYFYK